MPIASKDTFTEFVPQEVELDTTFKNMAVNAPANGTDPVFVVVFAPLTETGAFVPDKEKRYRFEDEPTLKDADPILGQLATAMLVLLLTSKLSLAHPLVAGFASRLQSDYNVELTEGMTLSDAAKLVKNVGPQLVAAQQAAKPVSEFPVPIPGTLPT